MLSLPHYPSAPKVPVRVFGDRDQRRRELLSAWMSGLNPNTLRAYQAKIEDYARFVGISDPAAAADQLFSLDAAEANYALLKYKEHLQERGLKPNTIGLHINAIKSLNKVALLFGICNWKLAVPAPPAQTFRDVSGPGRVGWSRMREAAAADDSTLGIRNRSLVTLAHDLALRRNEISSLDLEHVVFEDGLPVAAWVLGKGRTDRERYTLPGPTARALAAWLERRGDCDGPLYHRLDRGWQGQPERLSGQSILEIVGKVSKAAGLERTCKPHMIRHGAISEAARLFPDVEDVMAFARHRSYNTTRKYIDAVNDRSGKVAAALAEG